VSFIPLSIDPATLTPGRYRNRGGSTKPLVLVESIDWQTRQVHYRTGRQAKRRDILKFCKTFEHALE
jgi:hypothetical protein